MKNYQIEVFERLDDEDWNLPRLVKVVMKPKNTINNPPLKKTKFPRSIYTKQN